MKKILIVGMAAASLSLTTLNSRADGFSFSISLGHHHREVPVVVAPPPVVVHPAPVYEVAPHGPIVTDYSHHHSYWAHPHGWGHQGRAYSAHAPRHGHGYWSERQHGDYGHGRSGRGH